MTSPSDRVPTRMGVWSRETKGAHKQRRANARDDLIVLCLHDLYRLRTEIALGNGLNAIDDMIHAWRLIVDRH